MSAPAATRSSERTGVASLQSRNVVTGEPLGTVPLATADAMAEAVAESAAVQPFWAQVPPAARSRYLRRAAQVMLDSLESLGSLLAREAGLPRTMSHLAELLPAVRTLHLVADRGERWLAGRGLAPRPAVPVERSSLVPEPLGVVAVVWSGSSPWAVPCADVAVSLACGNGVLIRPDPSVPLAGQALQAVFERAGLPEGLVKVVHGGDELAAKVPESGAGGVVFTGPRLAGRRIAAACTEGGRPAVVRSTDGDSVVVLSDADVDRAASATLRYMRALAGGAFIARAYVEEPVADRFVERLVGAAEELTVGDPLEWTTDVGPTTSAEQHDETLALVAEAVTAGAELRCGGEVKRGDPERAHLAPMVLAGVGPDMRVARQGGHPPLLPVIAVESAPAAIAQIGMAAGDARGGGGRAGAVSIWTADGRRAEQLARLVQADTVWLNHHGSRALVDAGLPLRLGWPGYSRVKRVMRTPSTPLVAYRQPYDATFARAAESWSRLLYGRDADKRAALRTGTVPMGRVARRALADLWGR